VYVLVFCRQSIMLSNVKDKVRVIGLHDKTKSARIRGTL